jgi:hypothetical protein
MSHTCMQRAAAWEATSRISSLLHSSLQWRCLLQQQWRAMQLQGGRQQ